MPKVLIAGANAINFKGIDFTRYVVSWQDDRQPVVAMHTYLKRDGGEAEPMGRKPHETKFNLVFIGAQDLKAYKRIQASVDEDPKGVLVHPIHGQMRMCCLGVQGANMDVETALNQYNVPLAFVEDSVDSKTQAPQDQGPSARESQVRTFNTSMLAMCAKFTTASSAVTALSGAATTYATAAVAAAASTVADPTLSSQLASLLTLSAAASSAVLADASVATISGTAAKYDAAASVEQLYDACIQLDASVKTLKPKIFLYTVPVKIHILALSGKFYGKDGLTRVDEILANNPGKIRDPGAIPSGTQLLMATPTNPVF